MDSVVPEESWEFTLILEFYIRFLTICILLHNPTHARAHVHASTHTYTHTWFFPQEKWGKVKPQQMPIVAVVGDLIFSWCLYIIVSSPGSHILTFPWQLLQTWVCILSEPPGKPEKLEEWTNGKKCQLTFGLIQFHLVSLVNATKWQISYHLEVSKVFI